MDLFVVNLEHGKPNKPPSVIESGKPFHTTSYPTLLFERKWVRFSMVKSRTFCNTTISDATTGAVLAVGKPTEQCTLGAKSHITINARGRDGFDVRESFVSIRSVTWQSKLPTKGPTAATTGHVTGAGLPSFPGRNLL